MNKHWQKSESQAHLSNASDSILENMAANDKNTGVTCLGKFESAMSYSIHYDIVKMM